MPNRLASLLHIWILDFFFSQSRQSVKNQFLRRSYPFFLTLLSFAGLTLIFFGGLSHAQLGKESKLIFLSEGLSILFISPVLANLTAISFANDSFVSTRQKWQFLLPIVGKQQIAIWIAIGLSMISWSIFNYNLTSHPISILTLLRLHLVLAVFIVIGSASGLWTQIIFGRLSNVYSIQLAIVWWLGIIFSPFILVPLDRYSFSLERVIPYFLYFNPMIAICQLLEQDTSIFRTPYLYQILPVASYHFVYPNWTWICILQMLFSVLMLFFAFRPKP